MLHTILWLVRSRFQQVNHKSSGGKHD